MGNWWLNNISDNNYTDHEFKTLIRAALNNRIIDIERIAKYQYSENAAYAQSLLATLEGKQYDRISAKVVDSQGHSKRAINNFIANEQDIFTLFPNPTSGTFNIQISNEFFKDDSLSLLIYNMNGQLVQTVVLSSAMTTLSIESLPTGIYYCHLEDQAKVEKLVIVK